MMQMCGRPSLSICTVTAREDSMHEEARGGMAVTLNVWSTARVTFPAYHLCARARFKARFIVDISTTKPPAGKVSS